MAIMNAQAVGPQPTMERAIPGTGYPSAADIPELQDRPPGIDAGGEPPQTNPVLDAFKVLAMFAKAAEEKGMPNAGAIKEHLTGLMQSVVSVEPRDGGMGPQPEGPMPPAGPQQPPMPPQTPAPRGNMVFNPFEPPPEELMPRRPRNKGGNLNKSIVPLI